MCVSGNPWMGGMMLASARPVNLMWECVCENGDSTWTRMWIREREWQSMGEMDRHWTQHDLRVLRWWRWEWNSVATCSDWTVDGMVIWISAGGRSPLVSPPSPPLVQSVNDIVWGPCGGMTMMLSLQCVGCTPCLIVDCLWSGGKWAGGEEVLLQEMFGMIEGKPGTARKRVKVDVVQVSNGE